MSIWDYIPFGDEISDFVHEVSGIPSAQQKREQQNEINAQIQAYKDQTELSRNELNAKKDEEAVEKRRVEEKQIRALRSGYRSPGLLGMGNQQENDMTSKLGG